MSREDEIMLSLYYRWALQVLSALAFMHSRSIYLKHFCSHLVWLLSDLSLAITGFVSAMAQGIEDEYNIDAAGLVLMLRHEAIDSGIEGLGRGILDDPWDEGEWVGDEAIRYDEFIGFIDMNDDPGSAKEDLSVTSQ
jgi:hypothetical protein